MTGLFLSRQFLAFLVAGGTAALVNFGSRIFYSGFMSFSAAIVSAYITGMITAFLLMRLMAFRSALNTTGVAAWRFTLVNVAAVLQTWLISLWLAMQVLPAAGVERHVEEWAHAVGVLVPVFTSFIGHKFFSFRDIA